MDIFEGEVYYLTSNILKGMNLKILISSYAFYYTLFNFKEKMDLKLTAF